MNTDVWMILFDGMQIRQQRVLAGKTAGADAPAAQARAAGASRSRKPKAMNSQTTPAANTKTDNVSSGIKSTKGVSENGQIQSSSCSERSDSRHTKV